MVIKYLMQKYQETVDEWGESFEFIDILERFTTGYFIIFWKSMQLYANRIQSNFMLFCATMLRIISLVMGRVGHGWRSQYDSQRFSMG